MPRWLIPWTTICLWRWATGRYPAADPEHFTYHRGRKIVIWTFFWLLLFESVGTHLVLLAIFGNRWWVWLIFAGDGYTVIWILGLYAGMVVLPHRIGADNVHLRSGYQAEVIVPRSAIRAARLVKHAERKSGRLVVDGDTALFCNGEANLLLDLDPEAILSYRGKPVPHRITALHFTADDPAAVLAACSGATTGSVP
jgi:hypothetical protein